MLSENRGDFLLRLAFTILVAAGIAFTTADRACAEETTHPGVESAKPASSSPSSDVSTAPDTVEERDYDPWEHFNEKTFNFNHDVLDRYALKPVATVWSDALPERVRRSLGNAFDNIAMPRRLVSKVLQGRGAAAGSEVARFLINSTVGVAGFFDPARKMGLKGVDADMGQTFGVWGYGPGPYLVLPVLPPLTVRDAIGYGFDSFLDPLGYFIPIAASFGRAASKEINDRAANLKLYQDVEDNTLDLYGAVRNGYLQTRRKSIQEAVADRDREKALASDTRGLPFFTTPPDSQQGGEQVQPDAEQAQLASEMNEHFAVKRSGLLCAEGGDYTDYCGSVK